MNATDLIITIADRFPTLRNVINPDSWDVNNFMRRIGVLSTGEQHARRFIATVWNPSYAREKRWNFDAIEALGDWDSQHQAAFLAWASDPRWP